MQPKTSLGILLKSRPSGLKISFWIGGVAPPPPPATAGAYKKKSAGGPTALIQKLANELKMEIQANEMDEKNAQEDYEELMAESASMRAADSPMHHQINPSNFVRFG